jgi:glycosyltransferase involved in cell wall biosynthesis
MGRALRPPVTGIGRYTRNLLHHIGDPLAPDQLVVFTLKGQRAENGYRGKRVVSPLPDGHEMARLVWEQTFVPLDVKRLGIDVYHSPNHVLPMALPCKSVVTVHDLSFLDRRLFNTRRFLYLNLMTRPSIWKADRIICISEHTKRNLEEKFPSVRQKTRLVYQGLDPRFETPPSRESIAEFKARLGLGPYVLYVGAIEPRKNLVRLIHAFETAVREANVPHDLALCGPEGWRFAPVMEAWRQSPLKDRIRFMDYVPESDIQLWYGAADVLAYPSLAEGFGLPALEAMACGTPVVTSNVSALPELVGDAAITVSPESVRQIADGLIRVLTDKALASEMSERGLERSRLFRWEKAAAETVAVYREAAGG